jgi:CRP/FNR family transcriptional regulator
MRDKRLHDSGNAAGRSLSMTPIRRGQSGAANGQEHGPAGAFTAPASAIISKLEPYAVKIPARRRQKLAIPSTSDETLYYVRRGVLLTHAECPAGRGFVLSILYADDVFSPLAMPSLPGAKLTSAADNTEVWRLRGPALSKLASSDPAVERFISRRLAEQSARLALHNVLVASLEGHERVAALIAELALRIGTRNGGSISLDMPLSRMEIAGYLALNADTVSRIFSRLRSEGVIAKGGHGRIICHDIAALEKLLPAALASDVGSKSNALPLTA